MKRTTPGSMPPNKKSAQEQGDDQAASAARAAWNMVLSSDAAYRSALGAVSVAKDVEDMMDRVLEAGLQAVLKLHALPVDTITPVGTKCDRDRGLDRIDGARCRSCWKDTPVVAGCYQHQWCDMCFCGAATDDDERMCALIRSQCPDCTKTEPCAGHDDEWENSVVEDDDESARPWHVLDAIRARHASGDPDTRHPFARGTKRP